VLTENLRGLLEVTRTHVNLAQAKNIKATIDWVKDQDRVNKTPSIADLDEESFIDTKNQICQVCLLVFLSYPHNTTSNGFPVVMVGNTVMILFDC
jgi:hypothetical protein